MRDIDFFQCFGNLSSVLRTTKERGSRCSGATGEMSGEMVEMEAVLPGDTVDTSSESAEREGWLGKYLTSHEHPHLPEFAGKFAIGRGSWWDVH